MTHTQVEPKRLSIKEYDEYFDLGSYYRPVSTVSEEAQAWFDRGLVWCYAFNHEEGVTCFERAIELDPHFAMAHWGVAYGLGPNYNKTWEDFEGQELRTSVERTHQEVRQAQELAETASEVEKLLIDALAYRYRESSSDELSPAWNQEYADAMGKVYDQFPNDLDVAVLYGEALMNLTPWELWDQTTGNPTAESKALRVKEVFDRALTLPGGMEHPGLLHFYIHLMEMSAVPEAALTVADRLRGLVPDGGHLEHMPTHLDVLCGDYRRVISSNEDAIRADERFVRLRGPMNFYTLYRSHDYHFRIYGAMFVGQYQVAFETSQMLEDSIPEDLLRVESPPMADWLEGFLAMRVHVFIRFGKWQEIIDLPFHTDRDLYCVTTTMQHYARGVAFAALERVDEAEKERELFREAYSRVHESRTLFNNTCIDILAVAEAMLDGELEYRKGNYEQAFAHLRRSIELDDSLPYDEPWGWMQPTRHAYGALLLEQGRVAEAAEVYTADLGYDATLPRAQQHMGNVWALHGLHECLQLLGRNAEATIIEKQLRLVSAVADVPIEASCFCRLSAITTSCCSEESQHENSTCCS